MEPHPNNRISFPFFYSQSNPNHTYDDDSDHTTAANDNRSESASSFSADRDHIHMFEKPLTPSDVGKLNRLVIPKQHAEKYFPLAGTSTAGAGGVLLDFEDEAGKCWSFRYSYWNSSQSYVLTKGWSRYVKEKKLDAGDVVFFERNRFEPDRFFIGWRRRRADSGQPPVRVVQEQGWTGGGQNQMQWQDCPTLPYQTQSSHAGIEIIRQHNHETQKASKTGNSKRLRLFGVNFECQLAPDKEDPEISDESSLSSQAPGPGPAYMGPTPYNYTFDYVGYPPTSTNHRNHYMGINFSQDVNQMRSRFGR